MDLSPAKSGKVRLNPALQGAGFTFAAFLILANNTSPLFLPDRDSWLIFVGCMVGVIAAALFLHLAKRTVAARIRSRIRTPLLWLQAAGFTCVVAGLLINALASLAAGILAGAGFLLVMTIWFSRYAALTPENALFNAAIALGISGLVYPLSSLPILRDNPFVCSAALLLLSVLIHLLAFRSTDTSANADANAAPALSAAAVDSAANMPRQSADEQNFGQRMRGRVSALWKPLLSAMIAAFIIGLVHNPEISGSGAELQLISSPLISVGAPLLVSLLTLVAFSLGRRTFTLHIFSNVVMPASIALLLVVPMLPERTAQLMFLATLLSQCSFAVIALATWVTLAQSVRIAETSAWTLFPLASGLLSASTLLGLVMVHLIGKNGQTLCLVLLTVFLLLMVVDFALQSRPKGVSRELRQTVFKRLLASRCDTLASEHHLTAREREILVYLARGYSHVYIAKELYVSENTVRTHVKHIYSKLDVNNREAIINMTDNQLDELVKKT